MIDTQTLTPDATGIGHAAQLLKDGALVAFPTETVYGLGADARNGKAVAAIFEAKGRPSFNPLIVHVASIEEAKSLVELPFVLERLARVFWPGPLTLVAPVKEGSGLSELVSAGLPTVAVRVPNHPLAKSLLEAFGGPVAAPSANVSGSISPTTVRHVLDGLAGQITAVVDGGRCSVGLESTIIGARGDQAVLLRLGGLPPEVIEAAAGGQLGKPEAGKIEAPGQLLSHYAPSTSLRLNAEYPDDEEVYLAFGNGKDVANSLDLSPSRDMREAAANLFAHLHDLDELAKTNGLRGISAAPVPEIGLGLAINDRLKRAATPR